MASLRISATRGISLLRGSRRYALDIGNRNMVTDSKLGESQINVAKLRERGIIRVIGKDSTKFLQGLITNNMSCFVEQHCQLLYSALLNAQGRVLFDIFVYKNPVEADHFLLECDQNLLDDVTEHLKRYRLRSKVEVLDARNEIEPWFLFDSPAAGELNDTLREKVVALADPRLTDFGTRILMPWNQSPSQVSGLDLFHVGSEVYRNYRHRKGIAEGTMEISPGKALPLEYNFALLNGVSFTKGCYIGQELTARTHHTGVIRKRVMPISLKDDYEKYPVLDAHISIKTDKGKSAGNVIAMNGGYGLGLLRVNEALTADNLVTIDKDGNEISLQCEKPSWWPEELKY